MGRKSNPYNSSTDFALIRAAKARLRKKGYRFSDDVTEQMMDIPDSVFVASMDEEKKAELLKNTVAAEKDPWAHRNIGMRCVTCMWFVGKGGGDIGRCRRHAPTLSGYPAVYLDDWCGDHKLDENKV